MDIGLVWETIGDVPLPAIFQGRCLFGQAAEKLLWPQLMARILIDRSDVSFVWPILGPARYGPHGIICFSS